MDTNIRRAAAQLLLEAEDDNEHYKYAVSVVRGSDSCIAGHVRTTKNSRLLWFFLKRGGRITCRITGRRKLGVGLVVTSIYNLFTSKTIIKISFVNFFPIN